MDALYFKKDKSTNLAVDIVEDIAERCSNEMQVTVVSNDPKKLCRDIRIAWINRTKKLSAQRNDESDVVFILAISQMISTMQRIAVECGPTKTAQHANILVIHPTDLSAELWERRSLIVCADTTSFITISGLLKFVGAKGILIGYNLDPIVDKTVQNLFVRPYNEAERLYESYINSQLRILDNLGIDASSLIEPSGLDLELLGKQISALRASPIYCEEFIKNQNLLAELRLICGYVHHLKHVDQKILNGLRVLTSHMLETTNDPCLLKQLNVL